MTDPEVLLVAGLATATLLVLVARLWRRDVEGDDAWSLGLGLAVVGTGLFLESSLVGSKAPMQALVIGLVGVASVPRLLELRLRGTVGEHPRQSRLALVALLLSTTALMVNLLRNPLAPALEVYSRVLAPVFWALVTLAVLLGGLHRRGFVVGALAAFSAVVALMPLYPRPTVPCVDDKCSVFGSLLTGPYSSENFLSVVAGSMLFLALTLRRDALSLLAAATAGATLLAAGGRGSFLAAGLGLAVVAVLSSRTARAWVRDLGTARRRTAALLTTTAFAVVGLVLMLRADTSDFSRRGRVWGRGLAAVREDWVLGPGLSRWDGYEGVAAVSHHYPHSQYLLVLFSAGLVGLGLYSVLMAAVLSSALALATESRGGAWLVGHVAFLLTVGLVEVVLNPLSVDGLSWVLLAHLLPLAGSREPAHPHDPTGQGPSSTPPPAEKGSGAAPQERRKVPPEVT